MLIISFDRRATKMRVCIVVRKFIRLKIVYKMCDTVEKRSHVEAENLLPIVIIVLIS